MKYLVKAFHNGNNLVDKFAVEADTAREADMLANERIRNTKYHHNIWKGAIEVELTEYPIITQGRSLDNEC
jgi:hypothetical protein